MLKFNHTPCRSLFYFKNYSKAGIGIELQGKYFETTFGHTRKDFIELKFYFSIDNSFRSEAQN